MPKLDPTKIDTTNSPAVSSRSGSYARTRIIREYFLRHPGIQIWLIDLREIQIAAGVYEDDQKIITAINNTRNGGMMNIETLVRGQSWVYRPNKEDGIQATPNPTPNPTINESIPIKTTISERLYREKMITKSGDRILEDEDGILFRATELDL